MKRSFFARVIPRAPAAARSPVFRCRGVSRRAEFFASMGFFARRSRRWVATTRAVAQSWQPRRERLDEGMEIALPREAAPVRTQEGATLPKRAAA